MSERHFLVIGGSKGTGRVLVNHLVADGAYRVSVFARSVISDQASQKLEGYAVDVCHRDALLSCLDRAVKTKGLISSVVFLQRNRGNDDDFERDMAVSIGASKTVIDHLVEKRGFAQEPSIVFVSSIADTYIAPEQAAGYHVGKAGLAQLARFYALKLGPMGIRVNTVSPCVVAKDEAKEFYQDNAWLVDRFKQTIPLGRMGRPQDIVNAILFLAGDNASYITGQNIVVDGGLTLRSHESLIRDFSRRD